MLRTTGLLSLLVRWLLHLSAEGDAIRRIAAQLSSAAGGKERA